MNVTLAPELEQWIAAQIESGRYASPSEVVSEGLRLLQRETVEPLHARVDDALLKLTRGEGAEGEAYIEDPDGRLEESQEDERPIQR